MVRIHRGRFMSNSSTGQPEVRRTTKKRVLIVNCYFPEIRQPVRLPNEVPNTLAPVFLAGAFHREHCDVRCYNEVSSGFLEVFAPDLLAWPDMIVLTGLVVAFDRMLHVTAYVRSKNPKVVVVAGGQAIRAVPRYAEQFFDYTCLGDAEQLGEVIAEAFGQVYVAEKVEPRYDVAYWIRSIGYLESTRNCNFRCDFCSLTGEARAYETRSLDHLRQQILAMGPRKAVLFLDNQFFGPNRQFFVDRMALLKQFYEAGFFKFWVAICTNNILWNDENLQLARDAGCRVLFIGVESFDRGWLDKVNKRQNNRRSQIELIERCLKAGVLFQYGIVFDSAERRVREIEQELDFICGHDEIPPPNFIFMAIPFPGTPFFHDRFEQGLILPNTKLRDMEGSTVSMLPLDGLNALGRFVPRIKYFKGYRQALLRHQMRFLWRYRKDLELTQALVSSGALLSLFGPSTFSNPMNIFRARSQRTHISTTDRLDVVYTPHLRIEDRFKGYFEPTTVVDYHGRLDDRLAPDVLERRYAKSAPRGRQGLVQAIAPTGGVPR